MTDQEQVDATRSEELRLDLTYAMFHRDVTRIKLLLQLVSEVGYEETLNAEVSSAILLLQRIERERDLSLEELKNILNKACFNEIRSMNNPPVVVKAVMTATLLLLGHSEQQAQNWSYFVKLTRPIGRDSLLMKMLDLNIRNIPVDVALAARRVMQNISLEITKNVNLACAIMYKWVDRVIEEVLTHADCSL